MGQKELRRLHELLTKWIDAHAIWHEDWGTLIEARRAVERELRPPPPQPDPEPDED
jgi:hypothetical protein